MEKETKITYTYSSDGLKTILSEWFEKTYGEVPTEIIIDVAPGASYGGPLDPGYPAHLRAVKIVIKKK